MPLRFRLPLSRAFLLLWSGQTVSLLGSRMTSFATILWVWQLTGQATALSFIWFSVQVPQILISSFSGLIVDRWNRKYLMMLGDTIAGISTVVLLLLYATGQLHIWHLYLISGVNAAFGQIQELAQSASVALMVPHAHYSRASSLEFLSSYGSRIIAPAIAGVLYPLMGLPGILGIDLATFAIAIGLLLIVKIPQLPVPESPQPLRVLQELKVGWQYLRTTPGLLALLLMAALFQFVHDLGDAIYAPMILARSGNDPATFGSVSAAAGLGGVTGALIMSAWGGPQPRIHGMLLGMIGAGVSKTLLGFGRGPGFWLPAQFCSSLNFPVLGSSEQAIWLSKVQPQLQGRVFATRWMTVQFASPFSYLLGGPLADYVFEPAMKPEGTLSRLFAGVLGTGPGSGMALLYILTSLCLVLIGVWGYTFTELRQVEKIVPDHDAIAVTFEDIH